MRHGQNNNNGRRRGRGRRQQNPLNKSYESNGPDVKIRGNPATIVEKYLTLARDAQSSGDRVIAENYLQHAEHYQRIINAYAQTTEQKQQSNDQTDDNQDDGDDNGAGTEAVADAQAEDGAAEKPETDDNGDEAPKKRTRRPRKPKAEQKDDADGDAKAEEPKTESVPEEAAE